MFYLFYGFIWLITWLPLGVLYLFSDFFFLLVYFVAGYRKKVVRENLNNSFPTKTEKEKRKIERQFYRFFCDLFIEILKEMHMSKAEICRRMTMGNLDEVLEQTAKGKSVMLMTAHYGNWEWTSAISAYCPQESLVYAVYRRLKNKNSDSFIYSLRSKLGAINIEKSNLVRTMIRLKKEGKPGMFGMISDQTPSRGHIHYWTDFLNQDTATLNGTEQLARKFDYPVFFARITRKKRGYYHCELIPISLEPKLTPEFEITETYMRLLEKTIIDQPAYWLWSHRRWKNGRKVVSEN